MLVGTCETRPKSRELMKVMGIVLRRIRSAGSVTKKSLQELCLQVQTLQRKKNISAIVLLTEVPREGTYS